MILSTNSSGEHCIQECQTVPIPPDCRRMKFDRIEVAHGIFSVYLGRNGRGKMKSLNSISGFAEYRKEDIGFSKVKSVKIGR